MIDEDLIERIVRAISDLEYEYQRNQGLILSEADLECLIFQRLSHLLPNELPTADHGITGSPLHAEISFFDENGSLRLRPDITILEPRQMSIKRVAAFRIKGSRLAYGRLPSKGFEFHGRVIVIEIKFYKSKAGIQPKSIEKIKADIDKFLRLRRRNRPYGSDNAFGIMVVFNKTNRVHSSFHTFLKDYSRVEGLRVVYGTGNVVL
jgi:hypothetical protein